jgi:hypothetical protein
VSSGEIRSTTQIKKAAIKKLKKLKVIILKGKLAIFKIGLTKAFNIPNKKAVKSRLLKISSQFKLPGKRGPKKDTPPTNLTANQRVRKAIITCQKRLESIYIIYFSKR